jgi:hypothetical protein
MKLQLNVYLQFCLCLQLSPGRMTRAPQLPGQMVLATLLTTVPALEEQHQELVQVALEFVVFVS